ncbi:hypothetical protein L1987_74835 [Smallanthus sonchifolius]|uniref:Uncharacterized protein n=1 Tax=Smallanthus sonchifolius TaxID=185202 RepID=A0ACB9A4T5_9ASTR|nr:hypothetical protein L1987_74835 [Smallanthus sonchifolius]
MLSSVIPPAGQQTPSGSVFGTTFDPWDTHIHQNPFLYPTDQQPLFSGTDAGTPAVVNPIDDRKQRRMISNRESARRSRMRKQKHLENLRNLVNRHKIGNREVMNRLRFVSRQEQTLRQENERLRSELGMLRQKLWDLHQVMLVWQLPNQLLSSAWPCNNNVTSFNEQNPPSLIT